MEIRDATVEDAAAACLVMRRSIAELCVADHENDKAMLTRWLGNKTPEVFVSWIAQPGNSVLIAIEDGNMLAVGSVTDAGNIGLNYVSPDARFRGVSRGLLGALEARAVERGNTRSQAPRLPGASIGPMAMPRMTCQPEISEPVPATRCPRCWRRSRTGILHDSGASRRGIAELYREPWEARRLHPSRCGEDAAP
jgi:Acetyltransferase (GNAT) domain